MAKKILLTLFFISQVYSSNAQIVNACKTDGYFNDINKIHNLREISIEIKNSKKWQKNILSVLRINGWITDKNKKKHSSRVTFSFNNDLECSFLAKIKFHGDAKDHIKKIDEFNYLTSLNVKLINANINNITEFKLFLPATRLDDNEIITTKLLRELGFFAPRTKKIRVKVNGIYQDYLFQEKISKEFIESYGFTEGPIIEGDQRFYSKGQRNLQLARIVNRNWVKKNWRNAYIALNALSRVNELYLKFYNSIDNFKLDTQYYLKDSLYLLSKDHYKNELHIKNQYYDRFISSISDGHALVPDNRTFYYNYIENNFYPIYYDGHVTFDMEDDLKFDKNKSLETNVLLDQIKNLDLNTAFKNNNKFDAKQLNFLKKNIPSIIDSYIFELHELKQSKYTKIAEHNLNNYYGQFDDVKIKLIFFHRKPNLFLICNQNLTKCDEKNFNLSEVSKIVSQKFKNDSEFKYIFINSNIERYKNNHPSVYKSKWEKIYINENFYAKKTIDGIDLNYDLANKEVFIKQKNKNGRVIFFTKNEIKNWRINFSSVSDIKKDSSQISRNDLDGCVTFYNSKFKNLDLIFKEGFCEDSINFIRSKGSIKKIQIFDAFSDGLDMDFSKIDIENIYVKNSGNDCVDLSFGDYQIDNFQLEGCKDNGVSVGEKSKLVSVYLNIKNSKTGLAVKDSSKVIAYYLNSQKNKKCFNIYNKKPEFLNGSLTLEKMSCDNNIYNISNGSRFILNNAL